MSEFQAAVDLGWTQSKFNLVERDYRQFISETPDLSDEALLEKFRVRDASKSYDSYGFSLNRYFDPQQKLSELLLASLRDNTSQKKRREAFFTMLADEINEGGAAHVEYLQWTDGVGYGAYLERLEGNTSDKAGSKFSLGWLLLIGFLGLWIASSMTGSNYEAKAVESSKKWLQATAETMVDCTSKGEEYRYYSSSSASENEGYRVRITSPIQYSCSSSSNGFSKADVRASCRFSSGVEVLTGDPEKVSYQMTGGLCTDDYRNVVAWSFRSMGGAQAEYVHKAIRDGGRCKSWWSSQAGATGSTEVYDVYIKTHGWGEVSTRREKQLLYYVSHPTRGKIGVDGIRLMSIVCSIDGKEIDQP